VLLAFAAAVFAVVRGALIGEVRTRLHDELSTTVAFVRDNPGDVAELGEFKPDALILVLKGQSLELRSGPWQRIGLPGSGELNITDPDWLWEHLLTTTTASPPRMSRRPSVHSRSLWLAWTLGISVPMLVGLSILGGYLLAGRMLSPVRRMAAAAEKIDGDRLAERLPVENPADELGRLATVTNRSLDRLQEAMERQRRFTADASHEMRTPLRAIRSAGVVALRRAQTPTDYRETIGSMLEGVGELTSLIDRLLLLARAEAGTLPVKPERFDASDTAREVSELLQPVADQRAVSIEVISAAEHPVTADRMQYRRAVLNILNNAIKHSPGGASVRVETAALDGP
jgi:signal transduction histidine kinase